jgi:hypothetical protein
MRQFKLLINGIDFFSQNTTAYLRIFQIFLPGRIWLGCQALSAAGFPGLFFM